MMQPGERFGRLTVVRVGVFVPGKSRRRAECRCECGNVVFPIEYELRNGHVRSCGCFSREATGARARVNNRKHGGNDSPEHKVWRHMRQRCKRPADRSYPHYGGRGIDVCARWDSFENFLVDMGPRPSPRHSIERIDNNKGYSPENCRWATPIEQASNKRNNVYVIVDGRRMTLAEAGRALGISETTAGKWARAGRLELVERRAS